MQVQPRLIALMVLALVALAALAAATRHPVGHSWT
jgi:hypothetical protein